MCDHSPEDCALRFDNVTGRLVCVAHVPPPTPRDPDTP